MDLEKIKSKRTVVRTLFTKLVTKIEGMIDEPITTEFSKENKIEELHSLKNQLIEKSDDLRKLDAEIENLINLDELEKEIIASDKYREVSSTCKTKLIRCIESLERRDRSPSTSNNENTSLNSSNLESNRSVRNDNQIVKLPRLDIPHFQGDCCEWLDFWNRFEVAIHNNESLSNVEKFTYLKTYLRGTALSAVLGFAITNENYESAIKLLNERFGRKDLIASSHLNKLMSMEPVKNASNVNALRKMYDKLLVEVRSLENLNIGADSYSNLICTVIMQKIPEEINLQFNRERKSGDLFDIKHLIEFLKKEIECREASFLFGNQNHYGNEISHNKQTNNGLRNIPKNSFSFKRSTASTLLTDTVNVNCLFCSKSHSNHECPLDIKSRKLALKNQGRCFICLKRRHLMKFCWKKNELCKHCNKSHHFLICDANEHFNSKAINPPNELNSQTVNSFLCSESKQNSESVLLQTFSAVAKTDRGEKIVLRILADGGSTRTFIERKIADSLHLKPISKEFLSIHTFGSSVTKRQLYDIVELRLWSLIHPNKNIKIRAVVVNSITFGEIKVPSAYVKNMASQRGIKLADLGQSSEVQILIGSDYIWEILGGKNIRLCKRIVASESPFGYVLQGMEGKVENNQTIVNHLTVIKNEFDDERVKSLWELESLGINSDKEISQSNDDILKTFEENTTYENGRYETRLLWKDNHEGLSSNYEVSKRRLFRLNNTFKRNEQLYLKYKDIINGQLNDGIIENAEYSDLEKQRGYFMPHHAVIKECKETSKVRICYDASSNAKGELSLNDCLDTGPNLNPDLLKIILKFRSYPIAFCADIERAFLEVGIFEEDRKFLKFLWGEERGSDLALSDPSVRVLRFKRVPFGVKCSPFLLAATLRLHANKYIDSMPEACSMIQEFYVDDLISGSDSVENAAKLSLDCTNILKDASMNLRQWATNSKLLNNIWRENELEVRKNTEETNVKFTVLGLVWDNNHDTLSVASVDLQKLKCSIVTKRTVLKACGILFDPLGLISPFSLRIKLLVQNLWRKGILWDDPIPSHDEALVKEWIDELIDTPKISIPRAYFYDFHPENLELHLFSDASMKAYGTVAYFRLKNVDGKYLSAFVISKTRLAPLKAITLPRLELMGALIAARLSQYLQDTFDWLKSENIHFWTDSQICLYWIKGQAANWKQFVRNRVSEIQAKTNTSNWRFCAGKCNPADKLTRGAKLSSLAHDEVWWFGPSWLCEINIASISTDIPEVKNEDIEMEKQGPCVSLMINTIAITEPLFDLKNYSKLSKVLRITSWIFRFVNNIKKSANKLAGSLTTEELSLAENYWIKETQERYFYEENKALREKNIISEKSKIHDLNPFLDEENIMRLRGRLQNSKLSYSEAHPIILPSKNHFTDLQIENAHKRLAHAGVAETLTQIREKFWILKGRQAVKKVLNKCFTCRKLNATKGTQITAPLPFDRISECSAFEISAVDFAGPLFVNDKSEKVYIALFTCAVTRAIHLEIVSDLTTEKYIWAFRRFISRRGIVKTLYSDNAKTFKRGQSELENYWKLLNDPTVLNFYGNKGIKCKYIVERAAWWGGFWERMVKITKISLRKVLGKALLCLEELQTILAEIEAIINSRPITYVYDNPSEPSPLTPSHFLVGKRLTSLPHHAGPSTIFSATRKDTLRRYLYREKLLNVFWKRWRNEYLLLLRSANHMTHINVKHTFQIGNIVLIKDDKLPRHMWTMAKVLDVHPGRDGKVRSCTLKTPTNIIRRPVQLLYYLEL